MQSPLDITEEGEYWLLSRDVSESPMVGGEEYFAIHDVTRPEELTVEDLPPAKSEAVRTLDREALDRELTIGKWQVTGSAQQVDELWPTLVADAEAGTLWAVKAMTTFGHEALSMYDDYLLTVYTPNYFDRDDVDRVRDHLRNEHGVTHELFYKPDIYTKKGIVADSADEFGLSRPARYVE